MEPYAHEDDNGNTLTIDAAAIMREHNPGAMGLDGARPFARTALRWMRDRGARDA
jgi:hypothetical protein